MSEPERDLRWQRLHPLTPLLRSAQLAYAVVIGALAPSIGIAWRLALIAGAGLLIAAWITAVYLRFRYRLTDDSLVISHGVLVRKRRVLPRSRIQNVDLRAGLLQRLLGVTTARIETAGGQRSEAVLHVVSRSEGERLRNHLVTLAAPTRPAVQTAPEEGTAGLADADAEAGAAVPTDGQFIRRLTPLDLVIAGATANRAGLLVGALLGGDFLFDFMPTDWLLGRVLPQQSVDPESAVNALVEAARQDFLLFLGGLSLLSAFFVVAGWGLSIFASVARYFDFTLSAGNGQLRVIYGMFTQRDKGFRRSRVQNVQIEEPILRRWLGLAAMKVQTAGYGPSAKAEDRMETLTPLARGREIETYLNVVFPGFDWGGVAWRRSHPRSRRRFFLRRALIILLPTLVLLPLTLHALLLLLALPFAWFMATLHYRHLGHARSGTHVLMREGFWNRRTYIIPVRKIQALHLRESPFQRRLGLATLEAETAGAPFELRGARSIDLGKHYGLEWMNGLAGDVTVTGLTF